MAGLFFFKKLNASMGIALDEVYRNDIFRIMTRRQPPVANKTTTNQTSKAMATKQAKKGGEFGANGEWYEGGKFINTVAENAKRYGSVAPKARKVEIEPYVWVYPENGQNSIYRAFAGIFGKCINGKLEVLCSDQTLNYCGVNRDHAQQLADRYNAGERWL